MSRPRLIRNHRLEGRFARRACSVLRGGDTMRWNQPSQLLLATTLVAAGCGNLTDDTTTAASAVLGDRLPGLQGDADLLAEANDAFNTFERRQRRPRTDLQRTGLRPVPHQRRHRRRRRADRAALRPLRQRRLQPARQRGRFVAPAVHASGRSPALNNQTCNVPLERRARRRDGPQRRPPDHADVRPRSGGRDARLVLRRAGRRGAGRPARHRQPRPDRRAESRRSHRRRSARRASPASGGRRACPA